MANKYCVLWRHGLKAGITDAEKCSLESNVRLTREEKDTQTKYTNFRSIFYSKDASHSAVSTTTPLLIKVKYEICNTKEKQKIKKILQVRRINTRPKKSKTQQIATKGDRRRTQYILRAKNNQYSTSNEPARQQQKQVIINNTAHTYQR
jgi:hypothetical protein